MDRRPEGDTEAALAGLLSGPGRGWLLLDEALCIRRAGGDLAGLLGLPGDGLAGRPIQEALPVLAERDALFRQPGTGPVHLRLKLADHRHIKLSLQRQETGWALLFEDVSLAVQRTETLSRRIRELETRCRQLERRLIAAGTPADEDYDAERGLYHEPAFIRRLVAEEAFARRWQAPLSVVVLGPPGGEEALAAAAADLRGLLRAGDVLGRSADGRLAILLPQTGADDVRQVAERIRALPGQAGRRLGLATLGEAGADTALETYQRALAGAPGAP